MRLEVGSVPVEALEFGPRTALHEHTLVVNREEIRQLVLEDPHFADVEVHVARPGESVRIVNALDVVEPRWKVSGPSGVFPGFVSPPTTAGEGRTHRLAGVAVVGAGEPVPGEPAHFRQRLIDMSGPGAQYGPFGRTLNLVLHSKPNLDFFPPGSREIKDFLWGGPEAAEYNRAMVQAGMKVAAHLGRTSRDVQPDRVETFELPPCDQDLPRVVCLYHHRGRPFWYGVPIDLSVGALVHPNECFDGAFTEARAGLPASSTYWEQNNEVLQELCRCHGTSLSLLGCLLFGGITAQREDKERTTCAAARWARLLGAQAALVIGTNPSNLTMDVMWALQKCERAGIKTTLIYFDRGAGRDDSGFVFSVPEADAIVCVGSQEHRLTLPAVQKVIGGDRLRDPDREATGELTIPLRHLHSAIGVQGYSRLASRLE